MNNSNQNKCPNSARILKIAAVVILGLTILFIVVFLLTIFAQGISFASLSYLGMAFLLCLACSLEAALLYGFADLIEFAHKTQVNTEQLLDYIKSNPDNKNLNPDNKDDNK